MARRIGQTPQNFNKKLKRETVSTEELMEIAEVLGVVFEQSYILENGEIGIFYLNGEAYIKKLQDDKNGVFLVSLNKKYPPIPVGENDRFDILGKVVGKNHPDEIKEYLQ